MLVHWIWFAHRPGLNDRDKWHCCSIFGILRTFTSPTTGRLTPSVSARRQRLALREKNLTSAEEILEACDREKLHILTCQDAAYPARLKNIADPPVVLYYKGRLPDFDGSPVIGVVGTRKASAYGLTTAKRMGYQIARCGGIVVSGMAYGIDGMAMSGALTAGAPAVGVLGCGADIVYPVSNRALFRDTEEYGCILSEFAPGTPPAKWTFPKRNRIISGLSCGVLVGGSAGEKRRADHRPLSRRAGAGCVCRAGKHRPAVLVGEQPASGTGRSWFPPAQDILSEYEALFPDKIRKEDARPPDGLSGRGAQGRGSGKTAAESGAETLRLPPEK